jgi:hypothetical protein
MLRELEPLVSQYARSRQVLLRSVEGLDDTQLDVCHDQTVTRHCGRDGDCPTHRI